VLFSLSNNGFDTIYAAESQLAFSCDTVYAYTGKRQWNSQNRKPKFTLLESVIYGSIMLVLYLWCAVLIIPLRLILFLPLTLMINLTLILTLSGGKIEENAGNHASVKWRVRANTQKTAKDDEI